MAIATVLVLRRHVLFHAHLDVEPRNAFGSAVALPTLFFDSMARMVQEHGATLTNGHVADVGFDAEQIPVPGGQHHMKGTNSVRAKGGSERASTRDDCSAACKPSSAYMYLHVRPPARSMGSSRSQEQFTACASSPSENAAQQHRGHRQKAARAVTAREKPSAQPGIFGYYYGGCARVKLALCVSSLYCDMQNKWCIDETN